MGVVTNTIVAFCAVPAEQLYRAFFLDIDTLIPQLLPDYFKSVEILSGDGGVGTIKKITLGGLEEITSMTQRLDVVDKEKMIYEYTIIDGNIRLGILDTIINHFEVAHAEGGCNVTKTVTYIPINQADEIPEERVQQSDQVSASVLKTVEAFLIANPDY